MIAALGRPSTDSCPSRVLSVGYDQRLLAEQATVLRSAGFDVTTVHSLDDACAEALAAPYNAVVIGYRVPEDIRNKIVDQFRSRSPRIAIVLLYRDRIRDASCADAVLSVDSGPKFLANCLQYLLQESPLK